MFISLFCVWSNKWRRWWRWWWRWRCYQWWWTGVETNQSSSGEPTTRRNTADIETINTTTTTISLQTPTFRTVTVNDQCHLQLLYQLSSDARNIDSLPPAANFIYSWHTTRQTTSSPTFALVADSARCLFRLAADVFCVAGFCRRSYVSW